MWISLIGLPTTIVMLAVTACNDTEELLLPLDGWAAEGEPDEATYPDEGAGPQALAQWAFVKGDMRLKILLNMAPKDGAPGELSGQLQIEPSWWPGLEPLPSVAQ